MSPGSRGGETVIVAGALAQRPAIGGHAWVFCNWLLGLRSLGYDVVFVDRVEPELLEMPEGLDRGGRASGVEESPQWRWLRDVMAGIGMDGRYALLYDGGRQCLGMDREVLAGRVARATVLFNFMGYLDPTVLERIQPSGSPTRPSECRRVFVDIDPGFPQLWRTLGLHDAFAGHDAFVTVGLNMGRAGCTVPDCGLTWLPVLPPVALDQWPACPPLPATAPPRFTSVCTWRGPFGPVEHAGRRYGLRVHQFRRYAPLPTRLPGARFELALDVDPADEADVTLLHTNGWRLADPRSAAGSPAGYRRYVQGSAAEFLVAKDMYIQTAGGWFSDRSACYLASGRPVVAQDTGVGARLPSGEGFLTFSTPDEAARAAMEVMGNPGRHAKAARDLAVDYLDASKVLSGLLTRLGVA